MSRKTQDNPILPIGPEHSHLSEYFSGLADFVGPANKPASAQLANYQTKPKFKIGKMTHPEILRKIPGQRGGTPR